MRFHLEDMESKMISAADDEKTEYQQMCKYECQQVTN